MADFSFDNANPDGSNGSPVSGDISGKPGSTSGESNAQSGANGSTGTNNGTTGETEFPAKKRRGRKPYPRDAAGNPIRPDPATAASSNKSGKEGLAVKNDKAAVKQNILGLHAMAAVLTRQPILALKENEGEALANSLCDVADYHGINILQTGGAFGLYASLCTVGYMIYVPRFKAIKDNRAGLTNEQERTATPGEARDDAIKRAGTMNFDGDIKYN